MNLSLQPPPSVARCRELRAGEQRADRRRHLADLLAIAERGEPRSLWMPLRAIVIGDLCLLGMAHEPFAEYHHFVNEVSPFAHTLVAAYTNGLECYVGTKRDYELGENGGYETSPRGVPVRKPPAVCSQMRISTPLRREKAAAGTRSMNRLPDPRKQFSMTQTTAHDTRPFRRIVIRISTLFRSPIFRFRLSSLLAFLLTCVLSPAHAAESPAAPRQAGPKAALPEMPADGSGVYRLNLEQALGAASLTLVLEVRQGRVIAAAGLPNRNALAWCPADASRLSYDSDRLSGTVTLKCFNEFDFKRHRRLYENKPNKSYEPYRFESVLTTELTLDVTCKGRVGKGMWTATWSGADKASPYGPGMKRGERGTVSLVREAASPPPAVFQCDLYLYAALTDLMFGDQQPAKPSIWLRVGFEDSKAVKSVGHVAVDGKLNESPVSRVRFNEAAFALRDGKMTGRYAATIDGVADSDFTFLLDGMAIGRRLVGTVTLRRGDASATTQWIGLLHDVQAWTLPLEVLPASWHWQHDKPVDEALAARAFEESLEPVMPGEPGKAGFWTWRKLTPNSTVSTIHPPCFDLKETEGAASYRIDITGVKETKVKAQFTADKPWRPLAPVWKELPPGNYQLVVVPLDRSGREIPGPIRMGILEKETAKPGAIEVESIPFIKRPPFAGPYATSPLRWNNAALAIGRWHRVHPGLYERRGIGISPSGNAWTTGGDHGYGVAVADRLWSNLAVRDLTEDAAERSFAEEMLLFNLEDLELHQRHNEPEGYVYDYQGDTPLAYWSGTAVLDAYLATGDRRWREVAMKLGRALVDQQKDNGAFYSPRVDIRDPKTRRGPHGFFTWREGAIEFGAAELLYLFGRLRRDLQTDEFVEAESKAYRWVIEHGVRDRFWPINVSHSISTGYPIWQHSVAALYFSRYLLECAPPERRDVKLATEVARWAEDVGVDWTRAPEGKQTGPITPRINAIDRYNNEPIAVNLLASIVFEELAQATGDELWSAKGEALATAVLQGTEPGTGRPASALIPNSENHCTIARGYGDPAHLRHWDFCNGWASQLLREYAALRMDDQR